MQMYVFMYVWMDVCVDGWMDVYSFLSAVFVHFIYLHMNTEALSEEIIDENLR